MILQLVLQQLLLVLLLTFMIGIGVGSALSALCENQLETDQLSRRNRLNPGQVRWEPNGSISLAACYDACAAYGFPLKISAAGSSLCFCGNSSAGTPASGCNIACTPSESCPGMSLNVSETSVLTPIYDVAFKAESNSIQLRHPQGVNISASVRYQPPTEIFLRDFDPDTISGQESGIVRQSTGRLDDWSVPPRPTFPDHKALIYVTYETSAAKERRSKTFKAYYPANQVTVQALFENNTNGYFPTEKEIKVTAIADQGSNCSAFFDFGDGRRSEIKFATPSTPITYRSSSFDGGSYVASTSGDRVSLLTEFNITVNSSITSIVVRAQASGQVTLMALRPKCSPGELYCDRTGSCLNINDSSNCSNKAAGSRAASCSGSNKWLLHQGACSAAADAAKFSGNYDIVQRANVTVASLPVYGTYQLTDPLITQPGDVIALHDPQNAIAVKNGVSEQYVLLSSIGSNVLSVGNIATKTEQKVVQLFGHRRVSLTASHAYNASCDWRSIACNEEFPYTISAGINCTMPTGSAAMATAGAVLQIPIVNLDISVPQHWRSHSQVPLSVIPHSGSWPNYTWTSNFTGSVIPPGNHTSNGYSSDGFYSVCVDAVNHVSSSSICKLVIIQHPVNESVVFANVTMLLFTTETEIATANFTFLHNISTSDFLPTNVTVEINYDDTTKQTANLQWTSGSQTLCIAKNYSRGTYNTSALLFNQISNFSDSWTVVVQEKLNNPALTASTYIQEPAKTIFFNFSISWGSDYSIQVAFGDGNWQNFTVDHNTHHIMLNHSYVAVGNYSVYGMISNRISSLEFKLDRIFLEIMYAPAGYALWLPEIIYLRRPTNVTNTKFLICRNASLIISQPVYDMNYNISLGDGSTSIAGGFRSCSSGTPEQNVSCATISADYAFCHESDLTHYRFPGNFSSSGVFFNKYSFQTAVRNHSVFSEIINLNKRITIHPSFSGNAAILGMQSNLRFPVEQPLKFTAITQFGHNSPLVFTWDFGDGNGAVTIVNSVEHKYAKPLQHTVKVNVSNPFDWDEASCTVQLLRQAIGVTFEASISYPMNIAYEVTINFGEFPTYACFLLDFSLLGYRVRDNGTYHMFGNESFCDSDSFFSSKKSASHWDKGLTDFYNNGYTESLTGIAYSKFVIVKNFTYYGSANITLHAKNYFSYSNFSNIFTVAKGYCSVPKSDIDNVLTVRHYKRNQVVRLNAAPKVSCYNISTHVKWIFEKWDNATSKYVNIESDLSTFYSTYLPKADFRNESEGDWYGTLNARLKQFTIPKFALTINTLYKVCVNLTMNDETTLHSLTCTTFTVYRAVIEPCLQVRFQVPGEPWRIASSPAQIAYGSRIVLDASCSVNPNKFEAAGENICWNLRYFCRRDCETINFGSRFTYDSTEQNETCYKLDISGGRTKQKTCFLQNALKSWHYLEPLSESDWKVNVSEGVFNKPNVENVYRNPNLLNWRTKASAGKFDFLYYSNGTEMIVDSTHMFESFTSFFEVAVVDTCDTLAPQYTSFEVKLTTGQPPIVFDICVSNCFKQKIKFKRKISGDDCKSQSYVVNQQIVIKFETMIENFVAGVDYSFDWQLYDVTKPLMFCPDDLTTSELNDALDAEEIRNKNWLYKDGVLRGTTGTNSPGLSIDPPDFFPASDGVYVLRVKSWRGTDKANFGFKIVFITINKGPKQSHVSASTLPKTGLASKTRFQIKCAYTDTTRTVTYSVGYSTKIAPASFSECTPVQKDKPTADLEVPTPAGLQENDHNVTICLLVKDEAQSEVFVYGFWIKVSPRPVEPNELEAGGAAVNAIEGAAESANIEGVLLASLPLLNLLTPSPSTASSSGGSDSGGSGGGGGGSGGGTGTDPTVSVTSAGSTMSTTLSAEEVARIKKETENRIKLKGIMVAAAKNAINNIDPDADDSTKISAIGMAAFVVQAATGNPAELTEDSITNAAETFSKISETLGDVSKNKDITYGQIHETVTNIFQGMSLIIDSAISNTQSSAEQSANNQGQSGGDNTGSGSNNENSNGDNNGGESTLTAEDRKKKSANVLKIQNNINAAAGALGNKIVPGEAPVVVKINSISIDVEKKKTSAMGNKKFGSAGAGAGKEKGFSLGSNQGPDGGSIFVTPDPLDPNTVLPAQTVVTQSIQNEVNVFVLAFGSSNMHSPVCGVDMKDESGTIFKVENVTDDSLIESYIPNTESSIASIKVDTNRTFLKNKKMETRNVDVRKFDGLFVRLAELPDPTSPTTAESASTTASMSNENSTETSSLSTATSTDANSTIAALEQLIEQGHMTEFLVFVRAGNKPTDTKYDRVCQLPRLKRKTCSRKDFARKKESSGVDKSEAAGTNAAETTTTTTTTETTSADQTTTSVTQFCNCTIEADVESCIAMNYSAPVTGDSWDVTECYCNNTQCFRVQMEMTTTPASVEVEDEIEADPWTCYFSPEELGTNETDKSISIGIRAINSSAINRTYLNELRTPNLDLNLKDEVYLEKYFSIMSFTSGCYFLNETSFAMETSGVYLSECSTPNATLCYSRHLTSFMSSFYVPPIQIDPTDSAWLKLDSNPIALSLILSIICFYIIILIWVRRKDEDDKERVGVTPLPSNHPDDQYNYEITIWTGARRRAGTTSNVSMILYGENEESGARMIQDPKRPAMTRGSIDSFLMTTSDYLGKITHMRLWHDNSGTSPSWYLGRILIEDLQTREKYFFICNRWFAFDEEDGMVDRVLTVSGKQELRKFDVVFWSKAQKNLNDGHIWLSVVTRPPRSKFTRVQRATACLTLLMSTMMVNLMFYGQSAQVESPQLIELGPLKFTAHSIFIAAVSTLIIVPINVAIVMFFKNRRVKPIKRRNVPDLESSSEPSSSEPPQIPPFSPRASENNKSSRGTANALQMEADYDDEMDEDEEKEKPSLMDKFRPIIKRVWPLPWYMHYVAYVLSFMSVAVCTYLMVEFGGVLGEEKTAEWLVSMLLTLVQSIILVQPVKIIALAVVYAVLVKKIEEDEDEVTKEMLLAGMPKMHEKMTMKDLSDPERMKEFIKSRKAPPPPDQSLLRELREQRIKEQHMNDIITDIAFYFVFLIVLTMAAYTSQDYRSYVQNTAVKRAILEGHYVMNETHDSMTIDDVKRFENAWDYINHTVIPTLYPISCYNNELCPLLSGNSTWDSSLYLIRSAQMRQLRIKSPGKCVISKYFRQSIPNCRQEYSMWEDEEGDFMPEWKEYNASYTLQTEWSYTGAMKMYGTPYTGYLGTYAGGGYVASLGRSRAVAQAQADKLKRAKWLDFYTRGLFVEFLVYNPNTNLFTFCELLLEVFNGGSFVKYPKFYTLRINRYIGANGLFYLLIDIIALIFILVFTYREIKALKKLKCNYFKDPFNIIDFALLICCICEIILFVLRLTVQQAMSYLMRTYPERFVNFQWLILWDEMNQLFFGLVVFIFTIRFLRLLSFNRKIMMLAHVLKVASGPLFNFMIMFAIVFCAFVQMGYLMFYKTVDNFKTPAATVETLGVMTLNKFDFTKFVVGGGDIGMAFFALYMVFVSFVLINFFLTIVIEAFSTVKNDWQNSQNKYEIIDYMLTSIKSVFGINPNKKLNHVDHQFAYLAEKTAMDRYVEDLDDKLLQLEIYIRQPNGAAAISTSSVNLKRKKQHREIFVS